MFMSALFLSVFSTTVWLVYALRYLSLQLGEKTLSSLPLSDFAVYAALVFAPVFVIWQAYGLFMRSVSEKEKSEQMRQLLADMKKNIDYTDLTMRLMLEAEHEIKDGFIIQKFNIFVADLNELLAEIVQRSHAVSSLAAEQLWKRVKNGERWAIGKAFLEEAQNTDDFGRYVSEKAFKDPLFRGTVREFCNRYQNIAALLEKHDRERVFVDVLKTGVMGKVYSILAPVAESGDVAQNESTIDQPESTRKTPFFETRPKETDEEEMFFSKLREKMEPSLTTETSLESDDSYQSHFDTPSVENAKELEKTQAGKELAYPFGGWMNDDES